MIPVVVSLAVAIASLGPVDDAIERARTQAAQGELPAAIETIREARVEHDDPDLLYIEAQLHRIGDDCPSAVPLYEAFLATAPPEEDRAAAQASLEQCRDAAVVPEVTPTEPETTPAEPPPPVVPRAAPQTQTQTQPPAPAEQAVDRTGLALWIGGGVFVAAGASTYGASWALKARANRGGPTLDDYLGRERRASTLSGVGIAMLGVGAAVLIGATIRHFVRRR